MNGLSSMPSCLADGRRLLEVDVPPARRKRLGQCFTGLQTGRLLAAIAVSKEQKRMVDPMAGHGDLIESAAERASRICSASDELMGVEIEPEAANLCEWRVMRCAREFGFGQSRFVFGDAFSAATWGDFRHFDLVITNPPYVRYQTLSNGVRQGDVKLLNTEATRQALQGLAAKLAPPEEHPVWRCLIQSYSGLADLSLPSWLLCGLLTAPSGALALVVPQTWLNRDYARIARYFFLRFFRPIAVVQESGQRWFRDALVPVSLVIGRRLPSEETVIPLRKRRWAFGDTPFADVSPAAASESSHVGRAFAGDDPEREFAEWLQKGNGSRLGVKLKRVSWEFQRDEVLSATRETEWFRRLEGNYPSENDVALSSNGTLPAPIASLLPSKFLNNARPLHCGPVRVGQGLRTGCNPFFYVDVAGDVGSDDSVPVLTSELLGRNCISVPAAVLRPVVRRQAELSKLRIARDRLRGRLLDLRGMALPEDLQWNRTALQDRHNVIPEPLAEYIRLAARTYLVRGETRTLIPHLSAVKPNGPHGADSMRRWYMVPDFSPRHTPSLCIPRIIHDAPVAILNSAPPVIVDANFSTLWCEDDTWSAELVFAVLNSTWGELCIEALGATLGGGALKLEATHLRRLPIPDFSDCEKESLKKLVREALDAGNNANGIRNRRAKIDQIIVSALAQRKMSAQEAKVLVERLATIVRSLRVRRRRNHKNVLVDVG